MIRGITVTVLLFLTLSHALRSQDTDLIDAADSLPKWHEKIDWTNLGVHAQISRQLAPTPGGYQLGGWVSTGLFLKRWQLGAFIATYEDNYQQILIFPNQFEMNYLYGGYYLGYTFIQKRWFQMNLTGALGKGDVLWERSTTFENYFRDTFSMYQLLLDLEVTPIRFIRPMAQLGYRSMSEIDMPGLNASQFTGWSIIFGVRFGLYTKRPMK